MTTAEWIAEKYPNTLLADGLHEALVGVHYDDEYGGTRAVYDEDVCIALIMRDYRLTHVEASEHFDFNVKGSMFEGDPIYIHTYRGAD